LIRTNRIRSIKDGKFRFITADALREYVRTLEQQHEESELDATARTGPATATRQRRWFPLPAPRRLLGRSLLRTDSLRETQAHRGLRQDPRASPRQAGQGPTGRTRRNAGSRRSVEAWPVPRVLA